MADNATVTFYKVSHCGYYKRNAKTSVFGGLGAALSDLSKWTTGLSLEETKTFDPPDSTDLLPVYVADMAEKNGDWLIAMWNQVPESEGGVASISAFANVGSPDVEVTELEAGRIPGFATYFWFLPTENLFATIRLKRSFTGQAALQKYLRNFLKYHSTFVVHNEELQESDDIEILGFRARPNDEPLRLIPRFSAAMCTNPSDIEQVIAEASSIQQISRKEDINLLQQTNLARWQRALQTIGVTKPKHRSFTEARLQYTADVQLSAAEVRSLTADWMKEGGPESGSDLGFRLKGKPWIWLSKSIARDEISVTLQRTMPEMFSLDALLASLQSHRKSLLKLLK